MSMIANLLRVSKDELEKYLHDSSLLEQRIYSEEAEPEELVSIDQTWDGVIFLLTGSGIASANHPLVRVLFSEKMIDEGQDLGYGPGHYLTPEDVVALNNEISTLTLAELKTRFNPAKMNEQAVFPPIWNEGDSAFDYIAEGFSTLQKAFAEASKNGEAIITFLN